MIIELTCLCDHQYMGANCEGSKVPTIKDNILNHHRMTSLMWYHEVLGNFTASQGVPYVLGETNSISVSAANHHVVLPVPLLLRIFLPVPLTST